MTVLSRCLSVADFEREARRRLPQSVYEFVRGGTEDERSLRASYDAFGAVGFRPRGLRDVSKRTQAMRLWGREYASPFGIAPTGLAGIVRHECDLMLAGAANAANVPIIVSGASNVPLEKILAQSPGCWYQGYFPGDRAIIERILQRLERNDIDVVVVTIDTCIGANRENNERNHFTAPFRFSLPLLLDGIRHPAWSVDVFMRTLLSSGIPRFANMADPPGLRITENSPAGFRAGRDKLTWETLEWLRERWKGRLVVKGVMHPADAGLAQSIGADALIVSSHGGRQLDGAIGPLQALPAIVAQVSKSFPVMIDGGFRRGTDVLKALALGARMVFVGRATLYGAAVAAQPGVARVIEILKTEIDRNMGLLGCRSLAEVTPDLVETAFRKAADRASADAPAAAVAA
jgi:L-lactate dehydrogenase (cytochrome)